MFRTLIATLLALTLAVPVAAQNSESGETSTGLSGQSGQLENILERQRALAEGGEQFDAGPGREDFDLNAVETGNISDVYREVRGGTEGAVRSSSRGPAAETMIQTGGMSWLQWREGPVSTYGGILLLGTLALLAVFYLIKGRIRISAGRSGVTILRFTSIERFTHWLLAGSFILLGITGLVQLFGRTLVIPLIGAEAFAPIAIAGKFIHNNVSWAFMLALILTFVIWIVHNIPSRVDWQWIKAGGGFIGGHHPPAKKFNAGQKLIFWSVILLGGSISLSGLSLLFPFEFAMFEKTFGWLAAVGIPVPTELAPQEEMQYAQIWHVIVSFVLMAIIVAHIYIGSIGMEGAYEAMGDGEVDLNWAREHHSLWVEEVEAEGRAAPPQATPAE